MAKLLLNADGKVLMKDDKVYKAPNNINIPQVTNIQLSESGVLSWTAPNTTELEEYSPTFSYIINVNGTELTSSTTSSNIISYLLTDSENIITIKVKAVLTHYSNNKQETFEAYSLPAEYIRVIQGVSFPTVLTQYAAEVVGNTIYIFGNYSGDANAKKKILKYNILEKTVNEANATFSGYYQGHTNACAVGKIIYLFGGYFNGSSTLNTIYKFDTETETLTTIETTLPTGLSYTTAVKSGKYIYLFGGNTTTASSSKTNTIYKFDTETETLTTLSTTLPNTYTRGSGCLYGNYIYLTDFRKLHKFDISTETMVTSLSVEYVNSYGYNSFVKGNYIYLIDGSKKIYKFDILAETYTQLDYTISQYAYVTLVVCNGVAYICGGDNSKAITEIVLNG